MPSSLPTELEVMMWLEDMDKVQFLKPATNFRNLRNFRGVEKCFEKPKIFTGSITYKHHFS